MRVKKQVIRQQHSVRDLLIGVVGAVAIGASAYALHVNANGWAIVDFEWPGDLSPGLYSFSNFDVIDTLTA